MWWYSLAKPDGGPVPIFFNIAIGNPVVCAPPGTGYPRCQGPAVPIGQGCNAARDGGMTATWDGVVIGGSATCVESPGSAATGCVTVACATPGHYVVTMCGLENDCMGAKKCIDVPFDYPTTSEVVGHIGP